jgi:predicted Rossmann-fold nucleotide-binding protein
MAERKRYQNIRINAHRKQVYQEVADFKDRYGVEAIIGICGGSENIGENKARVLLSGLAGVLSDRNVAILTGGTNDGIPKWGIQAAREFGIPTIGVYPLDGKKYALQEGIDLTIEPLPPSYGDASFGSETATLVGLANGLTVIGGEFGTLVEVATAFKDNKRLIQKGKVPTYVCPITGTGGIADSIGRFPSIEKVAESLPANAIYTGESAGLFLIEKLQLEPRNRRLISVG